MTALRRIVCAANRLGDRVVLGVRHFDGYMHAQIEALGAADERYVPEAWIECEQGFIDQFGAFYDRRSAYCVAVLAGQIIRYVGNQTEESVMLGATELYSENLY